MEFLDTSIKAPERCGKIFGFTCNRFNTYIDEKESINIWNRLSKSPIDDQKSIMRHFAWSGQTFNSQVIDKPLNNICNKQ